MTSNHAQGELAELRDEIRSFVQERDWDQYDSPKNLATALCIEAGELLEPFQWLSSGYAEDLSAEKLHHIRHEMADVFIYLIALADKLDTNLFDAVIEKMKINRLKYPAERVRGDTRKYTDYDQSGADQSEEN